VAVPLTLFTICGSTRPISTIHVVIPIAIYGSCDSTRLLFETRPLFTVYMVVPYPATVYHLFYYLATIVIPSFKREVTVLGCFAIAEHVNPLFIHVLICVEVPVS
jgi:hypothetical protein